MKVICKMAAIGNCLAVQSDVFKTSEIQIKHMKMDRSEK